MNQTIFALKNQKVVCIDEVESGLECGCVCPACGEQLVAKKGKVKAHHFAHYSGTECKYGYETSLHWAAKDIISKAGSFVVPAVYVRFDYTYKKDELVSDAMEIPVDRVELERRFDDIVPDIIIYAGEKELLLKISASHKVDEAKKIKIKEMNISAIEIDLSQMKEPLSLERLSEILLLNSDKKKWIYNVQEQKYLDMFYSVSDVKNIVTHGYINNCPVDHSKPYADVMDDCIYCEYCISATSRDKTDSDVIYCTGRLKISTIFDLKMYRKNKRFEYLGLG